MDDPQNKEILQRVLQRLEQNETRLTQVSQQLTQIVTLAAQPTAADSEADAEPEPEKTNRLTAFVTLSALIAAIVMVFISLFQMYLDPGESANAGMAAAFNRELVQNINYGQLYSEYRAYTEYLANSELQTQLERALAGTDAAAEENTALTQELTQAQRKSASSRLFFSMRYLDRDGNYDTERHLGEAWARAEQQTELNPQPYFLDADQQRELGMRFIWLLLWLTVALCIYEVVHYFNERRVAIRGTFVLAATLSVLLVILGLFLLQ